MTRLSYQMQSLVSNKQLLPTSISRAASCPLAKHGRRHASYRTSPCPAIDVSPPILWTEALSNTPELYSCPAQNSGSGYPAISRLREMNLNNAPELQVHQSHFLPSRQPIQPSIRIFRLRFKLILLVQLDCLAGAGAAIASSHHAWFANWQLPFQAPVKVPPGAVITVFNVVL